MSYTIDELSQEAGTSQRSIYEYIKRHLIPPPIKEGRSFLYTNEHLEALRSVRVLLRLGLPLKQVELLLTGRERTEVARVLAPVLVLARLLDETERRVLQLQRKATAPDPDELDLDSLWLEDPVSVKHKLAEAERQKKRLQQEIDLAGAMVLRELAGSAEAPSPRTEPSVAAGDDNDLIKLWLAVDFMRIETSRQLDEIRNEMLQLREITAENAFRAGLEAAYISGWRINKTESQPLGLPPNFADIFRSFVSKGGNTSNRMSDEANHLSVQEKQ